MPTKREKITSLPWPELDKIELTAEWFDDDRFRVHRRHKGVIRGEWWFMRTRENEWQLIAGRAGYKRDRYFIPNPDPRKTNESRIPHDVELKAKQFLADETRLKPKDDKETSK